MSSATRASSYQQALDLFHDLDDRFHRAETAAKLQHTTPAATATALK